MKLISWNVNGLRACIQKGFIDFYKSIDADIFSIQETKMQEGQITDEIKELSLNQYWSSAEKKGYSGTAVFSKQKPIKVTIGIDEEALKVTKEKLNNESLLIEKSNEGRIIVAEYEKFYLVNCYVPNSKRELERLDYRV